MLKKIGRFVSGRLQGSKGVKKYDQWMKENPWATTALGVGDLALGAYAAPKLLAGAGKLKGLLTGGKAATQAASSAGSAAKAIAATAPTGTTTAPGVIEGARQAAGAGVRSLPASLRATVPTIAQAPAVEASTLSRLGSAARTVGRGARTVGEYAAKNPLPVALALQGAVEGYGAGQDRRMERDLLRRQQQQQANLAQLLIPLYRQYYGEG